MILPQVSELGLEVPDEAASRITQHAIVTMPYHAGIVNLCRGNVATALSNMEIQTTYYTQQITLANIAIALYNSAYPNQKIHHDFDFPLNLDTAHKMLTYILAGTVDAEETFRYIMQAERALRDFDAFYRLHEDFFAQNWDKIHAIYMDANRYTELHLPVRIANLKAKTNDRRLMRILKNLETEVEYASVRGYADFTPEDGLNSLEPQAVHEYLFALETKMRGESLL